MKGHVKFAHLYVEAARTDKEKRNKYCGKSRADHLVKLQDEMQKYPDKEDTSLDELFIILFQKDLNERT